MKFITVLLSVVLFSFSAKSAVTADQVTKLLLPKLDKASGKTNRRSNEWLTDGLAFVVLKNKPGYGLAVLKIDHRTPNSENPDTEDHDLTIEVYLVKTTPKLEVASKGIFPQSKLCDCHNSHTDIEMSPSNATVKLGSEDTFIVNAKYDTGGASSTWGDVTHLNAFKIDGKSIIQILSFKVEYNWEISGRYYDESDPDRPLSINTKFTFSPTPKAWNFEGFDDEFLERQSVPIKRVFIWNEKSKSMIEIEDPTAKQTLCTPEQLAMASNLAKNMTKKRKWETSVSILEDAIARCSTYPGFQKAPWIESDLLLYQYKNEDYADCEKDAKSLVQRKDFSTRPSGVQKAILHNQKLCIDKNKPPSL